MYIGIDNTARKTKNIYVGVDGVAREVKKAYIGVNGVARLVWENTPTLPDVAPEEYSLIDTYYEGTTFTAPETGWYKIELISPSIYGGSISIAEHIYINGEEYYDGSPLVLKAETDGDSDVKFRVASFSGSGSCYARSYIKLKKDDTITLIWVSEEEIRAQINSSYETYEDIGIQMNSDYMGEDTVYGADYFELSEHCPNGANEHTISLITDWTNLQGDDDIVDTPYWRSISNDDAYVLLGGFEGSDATKTCKELGLGASGEKSPFYVITTEFSDDIGIGYQTATISTGWGSADDYYEPFTGCFRISKGIL